MPNVVRKDILAEKVLNSTKFQARAEALVTKTVESAKTKLLNDFDGSKVTQEINGGAESGNLTNTLQGTGGNLWGFIGFTDNPIPDIRTDLENIQVHKSEVTRKRITFRVILPSLKDLYAKHPYPDGWSPGSWLKGIENGISGLQFFLAEARKGRSTAGIQVAHNEVPIRGGSFKPVDYLSTFLENFKARVRGGKDEIK